MTHAPKRQGLYDPAFEHDACGVGFVAHIKGQKSRDIVTQALQVLINLRHRGAEGSDKSVGDGAGILLQLPHALLARASHALGFELPDPGQYGVAMIFSPAARSAWRPVRRTFEQLLSSEHLDLIGWRQVPTINADLGQAARDSEPRIMQAFVARPPGLSDLDFERRLYVLRRLAEKRITTHPFYICSLSHRTIVYKGMLKAEQLGEYFPDLAHPATISALAVVHSRFSTNTFPSWERAHPYRYVSHNGEINTLRGNVNWMHTRQSQLRSPLYGESLQKLFPVIDPTGSDSAMLDNVLEFLTLSGRTMAHAMMMMVPEPHEHHASMDPDKRAFYEFHACLMEPWDGPAAIVFTDGQQLGACLDRNGLGGRRRGHPARADPP